VLSDVIKEEISAHSDMPTLRRLAMKEGMRTLHVSGAQKIAAGLTTLEEVLRVAPPREKSVARAESAG